LKKNVGAGVSPCKASPYVRLDPAKKNNKTFLKGGLGASRKCRPVIISQPMTK
jgi:hypothetical protein